LKEKFIITPTETETITKFKSIMEERWRGRHLANKE
jgi:hypothetical protein